MCLKRCMIILLLLSMLCALCACGKQESAETEAPSETAESTQAAELPSEDSRVTALPDGTRTLGFYTDNELFSTIPAPQAGLFGFVRECNSTCYSASYTGITKEDYDAYVQLLVSKGFDFFADSGEQGINGDVFYSAVQQDELTVHLVFQRLQDRLTLIAGKKEKLSPKMKAETASAPADPDANNTMLMLDTAHCGGMSLFFRLKSGHFLIWDGAELASDAQNLIDHLYELTPEGEKPIIDGWFLTHTHNDHFGSMKAIGDRKDLADKLIINGIYYNEPNSEWIVYENAGGSDSVKMLALVTEDENGNHPEIYRPVMGQRLYFDDVTVEIMATTDFVPHDNSRGDFNDTSTIAMVLVDGQKVLITGDAEEATQYMMTESVRHEYFDLDVYQTPHHGLAVLFGFVDLCPAIHTVLQDQRFLLDSYSDRGAVPYLMEHCDEYYNMKNGTLRLDFPYKTGSIQVLGNDFLTYPDWDQSKNEFIKDLNLEAN